MPRLNGGRVSRAERAMGQGSAVLCQALENAYSGRVCLATEGFEAAAP